MKTMRMVVLLLLCAAVAMPAWAANKAKAAKPAAKQPVRPWIKEQEDAAKTPAVEVTGVVRSKTDTKGTSTTYTIKKEEGGSLVIFKSGGPDGRTFKFGEGCNPELYVNKKVTLTGRVSKHDVNGKPQTWMIIIEKVKILGDAPAEDAAKDEDAKAKDDAAKATDKAAK